jgi:hypothetical protein
MNRFLVALLLSLMMLFPALPVLSAEDSGAKDSGPSAQEIARELANPNNSLAVLTFRNQYRLYEGDLPGADDQDNYTLLFQPIFPQKLPESSEGDKRTFFLRPAIPILVEQPVPRPAEDGLDWDGVTALGDIGFDIAYGVTKKNGFLWAVGMVGTLPTATDEDVAGKQLRLGPEILLGSIHKWGLFGIFPSHQWNVTGWDDKVYNTTVIEPFLKFLVGDGWSVGSLPIGSYDWQQDQWTVPLNLTVSNTAIIGKTPWKVEFEVNYYVEKADLFGPEWMFAINISPVVNNPLQESFNRLIGVQ